MQRASVNVGTRWIHDSFSYGSKLFLRLYTCNLGKKSAALWFTSMNVGTAWIHDSYTDVSKFFLFLYTCNIVGDAQRCGARVCICALVKFVTHLHVCHDFFYFFTYLPDMRWCAALWFTSVNVDTLIHFITQLHACQFQKKKKLQYTARYAALSFSVPYECECTHSDWLDDSVTFMSIWFFFGSAV